MEAETGRPFVVCHMVSALDGKISGEYFETEEIKPVLAASNHIREQFHCEAVLYGATTMAETYADGYIDELPDTSESYPRTDYIAPCEVNSYYVAIDIEGRIRWENKYIEKRGRQKSQVIEVLTENISDRYLAYLRSLDISYIFAGECTLDCGVLLKKLADIFGIRRLMISGGGIVNWSFLQAGLIDELSLVLCPLTDGENNTAAVFDRSPYLPDGIPVAFTLENVQTLPGDGLWLVYRPKNICEGKDAMQNESAD